MTIADNELIEVQNLTSSKVIYKVPETNIKREFQGQQVRKIEAGELRSIYATKGGRALITDYLSVKSKELAEEFNIASDAFEHEYNWTEKDVDTVLKYGTLDALKDALEFGPEGIKQLIVDRALALKIPDNNKLSAIREFTGRDVANMIRLTEELTDSTEEDTSTRSRRVTSTKSETPSGRRVSK